MTGPGGEVQPYATSRRATFSVDAEAAAWSLLWRRWTMGAGQSVQVRVKGRRKGNVCGPDDVHVVTTTWGQPLVGTPAGGRKPSHGAHQPKS